MVVFTCGHCGESVQKPKVEKHYLTKCRNRNPNLSCMDCFKDFLGQDYESHTKCITEEERYSGKGFIAKEKKGEKKQNAWVDLLQSVLDEQTGAPPNVRRIIETISKHNNTPRKKPKFINFVKNVCGHKTNAKDMDQAWDLISVKLSALSVNNQNKNQNGTSEKPVTNGEAKNKTNGVEKEDDENGVEKDDENDDDEPENDTNGIENGEEEETEGTAGVEPKKLSKKQQKAEKRRQKYEAELKSATEPPPEDIPEENETKKGKKKKNRSNSTSSGVDEPHEGKNKNKKRKRQDTVNSTVEASDNGTEEVETVIINKTKTLKKKQKTAEEEAEESICLHDQNVAKIEELAVSGDKFNWHAAIMSVLQKKDNELPFKRLQKKVLSEYSEATGRDVDDRIADKFIKKLKSAPNVRVDKNRVTLIE